MTEKEHVEGFAPEVGWRGAVSTILLRQPAASGVEDGEGARGGLCTPGVLESGSSKVLYP